jgi:hypothetical protein
MRLVWIILFFYFSPVLFAGKTNNANANANGAMNLFTSVRPATHML